MTPKALERWLHGKNVAPYLENFLRAASATGGMQVISDFESIFPRLENSRGTPEQEARRDFMAVDFAVRVQGARLLRLAGAEQTATALQELPRIEDIESAERALALVRCVQRTFETLGWDLHLLTSEMMHVVESVSPVGAKALQDARFREEVIPSLLLTLHPILLGIMQRISTEALACAQPEISREALAHLEEVLAVTEQAPLLH